MRKIFIDFLWIQNAISRQKISRLCFQFRDFNFIGSICEHIVLFRGYIVLFGLCNFLFAQWISWPDCYRMSWWDDRSFISESELKKKPQKMRAQFGSKQSRGPHLIKERNHFITITKPFIQTFIIFVTSSHDSIFKMVVVESSSQMPHKFNHLRFSLMVLAGFTTTGNLWFVCVRYKLGVTRLMFHKWVFRK